MQQEVQLAQTGSLVCVTQQHCFKGNTWFSHLSFGFPLGCEGSSLIACKLSLSRVEVPRPYNMDYENEGCLHEIFERQMKNTPPTATAVVSGDGRSVSFSELDDLTNVLATNLRHRGVKRNSAVGIYLERSLEYPLAYISILKAGGAYMPLELSYPETLLYSILEDAKPAAIITSEHLKEKLPNSVDLILLNEGWDERLEMENASKPALEELKTKLDDLAYIVYSSGTTGKPKGMRLCVTLKSAKYN